MKKKKFLIIPLFIIFAVCIGLGLKGLIFPKIKTDNLYDKEKDAMEDYLTNCKNMDVEIESASVIDETVVAADEDEQYHGDSDAGYGEFYYGYIDCVLQIDKIDLKKIVCGGANEQNLRHYLLVKSDADVDMKLGKTSYIIYGHDSRVYGASFSRLAELVAGDEVKVIKGKHTYYYKVKEYKSIWAEEIAQYVEWDNPKQLILCTCEHTIWAGEPTYRRRVVFAELYKTE